MDPDYLASLNPAQRQAVLHPPDIPLQILAGPGSGKTKVLTTRVAHLILHHNISPSSICAVTFTNKAAKEMRERLKKLIGKDGVAQLKMGTFHALCAKFLRVYAELIGLAGNFTVCDADESKKILRKLLEPHKEFLAERNLTLKEATVATLISQAKAKGHNAADYLYDITHTYKVHPVAVVKPDDIKLVVAEIFKEYEQLLRHTNCLDFDDLLVFGVQLFREHSRVVSWCRHVLVDEFQDTNIMQYDLMKYLATAHECVTIVGDPDQSIYGWRSAEVKNLGKMQDDFYETRQILLEQNYRSTGSILSASIAIVSQDKRRIVKRLLSTHSKGVTPLLDEHSSELDQAINIATEIKRIVAYTGGMLGYNDFVILLRFNALSRTLEQALQKSGIPCRVLAGHKFFERLEIKDLLAYLQVVDNPKFIPAFSRIINVPGRGIGEKTLKGVLAKATAMKLTPMEVIEGIYDGEISDIKPPVKRKVGSFVKAIRTLRKLDNDDTPPPELIRRLIDLVQYEDHLKKTQQDWETRWENVQELINFASEVETDMSFDRVMEDLEKRVGGEVDWQDEGRALEEMELDEVGFVVDDGRTKGKDKGKEKAQSEKRDNVTTPLRAFLEASMLSTDVEDQNGESKDIKEVKEKVTIATCHAAKGLEWPVVFVPSVEKGIFPFSRSEDVDEERRLLYVACTRAQGLLALSYCSERMVAGEKKATELSHFILRVLKEAPGTFTPEPPQLDYSKVVELAEVLRRPPPSQADVTAKVEEYKRKLQAASNPEPGAEPTQGWKRPQAVVPQSTFVGAGNLLQESQSHQPALAGQLVYGRPLAPVPGRTNVEVPGQRPSSSSDVWVKNPPLVEGQTQPVRRTGEGSSARPLRLPPTPDIVDATPPPSASRPSTNTPSKAGPSRIEATGPRYSRPATSQTASATACGRPLSPPYSSSPSSTLPAITPAKKGPPRTDAARSSHGRSISSHATFAKPLSPPSSSFSSPALPTSLKVGPSHTEAGSSSYARRPASSSTTLDKSTTKSANLPCASAPSSTTTPGKAGPSRTSLAGTSYDRLATRHSPTVGASFAKPVSHPSSSSSSSLRGRAVSNTGHPSQDSRMDVESPSSAQPRRVQPQEQLRSIPVSVAQAQSSSRLATSPVGVVSASNRAPCVLPQAQTRPAPVSTPGVQSSSMSPVGATSSSGTGKRRLGMGRSVVGYPNKKFKTPGA